MGVCEGPPRRVIGLSWKSDIWDRAQMKRGGRGLPQVKGRAGLHPWDPESTMGLPEVRPDRVLGQSSVLLIAPLSDSRAHRTELGGHGAGSKRSLAAVSKSEEGGLGHEGKGSSLTSLEHGPGSFPRENG